MSQNVSRSKVEVLDDLQNSVTDSSIGFKYQICFVNFSLGVISKAWDVGVSKVYTHVRRDSRSTYGLVISTLVVYLPTSGTLSLMTPLPSAMWSLLILVMLLKTACAFFLFKLSFSL